MSSEQVLNVLYDMALASGGETRVRPLVTRMLQRLLYHTGFPCGLFLTQRPADGGEEGARYLHVEMAVGCHHLIPLIGTSLALPAALVEGSSALLDDLTLLSAVPQQSFECKNILRLRVSESELFLLLSPESANQSIIIASLFDTVLRNFGKNLQLCRENESYTNSLREENQRRQRVEAMLRQERDLFVAGPAVVFRWSGTAGWPILYVSENVNEQFGYLPKNLIEKRIPYLELVHPDDRCLVSELSEKRTSSGRGFYEAEYRIADAEGKWRWIYDITFPERDELGTLQAMNGYIIDITLRKRSELEQRLLATAFDAKEAIAITDRNNSIVRVNQAFTDITGYLEEEVVGYNPEILRSGWHDDDFYKSMWAQIHQEGHWEGEITNRRKDGDIYPEWLSITAVRDEQGEVCNYIAHFTDLSSIKEQQRRIELAAAQEQALSGLLRLALAESELEEFLGAFIQHLLSDVPWLSLLPKGAIFLVDEAAPEMLNMVASHGLDAELMERCHRVPFDRGYCGGSAQQLDASSSSDGDTRHEVAIEGMADLGHYTLPIMQEQELLGVLNIYLPPGHQSVADERNYLQRVVDVLSLGITKRYSQQQVIAAKETAEKASSAKSEFLSSMSHELRTPLNAILGFSQILEFDDRLDGEQHDNIHEIIKAGHHLLELINEVLDLAKIEAGGIALSTEQVEIDTMIRECLQLVQPLAATHSITLQEGHLAGVSVSADRMRLKQVLLNLLSNAIKYNHDNGVVSVRPVVAGEGVLRIEIVDSGKGIAPERIGELFQPFNRLEAEQSPVEGTGIGLTISKRLVELMNGKIGVESRLGEGSTFWFELPLFSAVAAMAEGEGKHLSSGLQHVSLRKVLYVEDNPVNVKLVSQLLSRLPYVNLLTAHAPELGLELALAHRPDLILLDINMPGMDGYQMLSVLKSNAQTGAIPVLAVSANAMPRDVKRAVEAGFADYFTKPLDARNFIATVEQWLMERKSGELEVE